MTKTNESVFAMILKVRNFYPLYRVELSLLPIMQQYFDELNEMSSKIIDADTGSRADLTGVTVMKGRLRNDLQQTAQKVSNGIAAYAVVNNDIVLQKRIDFPASKWYATSEEELVTQSKIVLNLVKPLENLIVPYGVTMADVKRLEQQFDQFVNNISEPSLAIDQRKNDNVQVVKLLEETRNFLNQKLDVLMRVFEVDNPELHQKYLSARAIDINGPVVKPTAEVEVKPKTQQAVYEMAYMADTLFTLRNAGTEVVFFSLSATDKAVGKEEVALLPGETRSRLAQNLAPSGSFLMVRNPGESAAPIKIWVE